MKLIFLLLLLSIIIIGQEYRLIENKISNKPMLVGVFQREVLQDSNFAWWFNSEYTNYYVEAELILNFKKSLEGKIIQIILGTWCSDSRREVPRFVKILDFLNFPEDKVFFIGVDRDKKGLANEVVGLEIEYVPTFIVYECGKEIGRIIEKPRISLEQDFLEIIN